MKAENNLVFLNIFNYLLRLGIKNILIANQRIIEYLDVAITTGTQGFKDFQEIINVLQNVADDEIAFIHDIKINPDYNEAYDFFPSPNYNEAYDFFPSPKNKLLMTWGRKKYPLDWFDEEKEKIKFILNMMIPYKGKDSVNLKIGDTNILINQNKLDKIITILNE